VAPRRERLPAGISTGLFFEIGAVAIGIARGALDVYENVLRTKLTDVPPFTRRGDQVLYQHHLGRSTGLVDLAEAGLFEAADRYLAQANAPLRQAGRPVDQNSEESGRLLLLEQQAVPLAGEAVDLTFRTSGTSGAKAHSALGNAMLSLTVIRTHMGLQWDRTMENVGRLRMGLTPGFLWSPRTFMSDRVRIYRTESGRRTSNMPEPYALRSEKYWTSALSGATLTRRHTSWREFGHGTENNGSIMPMGVNRLRRESHTRRPG
jgi:Acyl-CoA dehydrogenase, C-terminal domain